MLSNQSVMQSGSATQQALTESTSVFSKVAMWSLLIVAAASVLGVLIWQGITAHGNPDPMADGVSHGAIIVDTGVLVFREGLEAILVLMALTASLVRTEDGFWKPVAVGASLSFVASVATWFAVVGIISDLSTNTSALKLQAATGLLAIVVLLVIMNWFFHKVYWSGWITLHNRRKKELTDSRTKTRAAIFRGLAVIGFTSVYREGFEVVLFLQSLRLKAGPGGSFVVLEGVLIGLALTAMVGFLTFKAHCKLPYKRMLVLTGIMLGAVLLVMVGEQIQEMQLAGWMSTHQLKIELPEWMNLWFGVFPTVESLGAQVLAGVFVIGSYFLARRVCSKPRTANAPAVGSTCIVPDCGNCSTSDQPANKLVSISTPART